MNLSSDGGDSEGLSVLEDPAKEVADLGPSPPLAILSSRAKSASSLVKIANAGVAVVYYKYESTSLEELLQSVAKKLSGRRALSIALLFHGHPGFFKIIGNKSVNSESLRDDKEIRKFFLTLVKSHLDTKGPLSRVDLLACPVAQNAEGKSLVEELSQLMEVPVYTSSDIFGVTVSAAYDTRIGALYFDEEKLKEMVGQVSQNLALYEKLRVVGKGAFGAAVLYKKKDDESLVIIKEINMLDLKKAERSLALNEVQVLSMMDHPNIISLYDSFEENGVLMIEMEYADGGTLAQFIKKQEKPLAEPEILNLFKQMVDALRFLHDHRILHRDLKTTNVFLTKEGLIKLGDFGISKVLSATRVEANTIVGTAHYISPEICEGKPYNVKSDMWALGCILHEMATLQRTFDASNINAVVNKIVQVSFPPIKSDYSEELKELIQSLLQKEPDDRPTAEEIQIIKLPQLMERYIPDEGEEDTTAAVHTKSFLYQLEYHSLCLVPLELPLKEKVEQVALGFSHVLILTMEHFVYSYGEGGHGQLGHNDNKSCHSPKLIESTKEIAMFRVDCGAEFSVFCSCNGLLMTCGRGDLGCLGHGDWKDVYKPTLVQGLLNYDVCVVGCGEAHVVTLMTDGNIYAWGCGRDGRLGLGNDTNQCSPQMVEVAMRVKDVKCGLDSTMFLTSTGTLLACGSNRYNKLGLNQRTTFRMQVKSLWNKAKIEVSYQLKPSSVKGLSKHKVVDMSLGPTHSAVIVEGGRVVTFGRNSEGQLGCGSMNCKSTPGVVTSIEGKGRIMHVACGEVSTVVATENNLLFWGSRPLLRSTISCPITGNHSNNSSKDSSMTEPERKKRSSSTSGSSLVSSPPASTQRSLKSSSSFPDNSLAPQSDGDDTATTPFLLQCKSINETNRTPINEGSQYGQLLSSILESNDTKKHAANAEPSVSVSDWKKVFLSSHEIEFCTKNGVMLDVASSEITKLKVEGIACYGCNLLVLTEGQVAVSPTSMTSILDDPGTDITNIGNDIMTSTLSRTTFVMGRRLIRQSGLHRMDSRRGLHSPVRGASRGNTPDPGVHPEPTPPPKDDDDSPEDSKVLTWVEREYQIALKAQNTAGKPAGAMGSPLRSEKTSLKSILSDEGPQGAAIQPNLPLDNHNVPNNAPPLRRLDKITSSGDIGIDGVPSKSANSGFPKRTRNLLLTNDKRSFSSGLVENAGKQKIPSGLLPQEVTSAAKNSSLSRQIDGVRLPPVISTGSISHDLKTKVNSLPGAYTRVTSAKNITEVMNTKGPSSVSRLPDAVMRNPPSMFGSSPVVIGKGPQPVMPNSPPPHSSSPPLHSTPHGKPVTSNQHQLHRELSAVKSETSLSHFTDANIFEPRRLDAKSPSSVYESSPSDHDNTMTNMLMPQLLPLWRNSSTSDCGADAVELYSSSSASDGEMFGHQKGIPKAKKMLTNKPTPQVVLKGKPPKKVANGNINSPMLIDTGEGGLQKNGSVPKSILRNKGMSRMKVASTALDEMKAEQAKLQSQLNEFVKKQADYEEALKVAKKQSAEAEMNMKQELKLLEDEKKKSEQHLMSSHEKEKKELQFSTQQQLSKSQEAEDKLKAEIDALKSELTKQSVQLQKNQEIMEMLQKHIAEMKLPPVAPANVTASNSSINSTPQSKPLVTKSSPQVKLKGRRQSTSSNKSAANTKSKFCSVM